MSEGLINALECAHGPEQANQVSGVDDPTKLQLLGFDMRSEVRGRTKVSSFTEV